MRKAFFLFFLIGCFFAFDCNALEVCDMSNEYKKWLELGDEKFNYEIPPFCESQINKTSRFGLSRYSLYSASNPRYSSLELGYLSDIRDQKYTGSCWTFAANSCVETSARKEGIGDYDFSEKHMEYSLTRHPYKTTSLVNINGFNRELDSGGNSFYAVSYYFRFTGPILESEMPFTDYNLPIDDNSIPSSSPSVIVGNYDIEYYNQGVCSDESIKSIKDKIIKYGSVGASIYMESSLNSSYLNGNYFYYPGSSNTNHAVNIVGWDDSISSTNFKNSPSRNGAWIVRNSWGESFGDRGYFYISYDDTNICSRIRNFNDIKKNDYDNAYSANYGLANFRLGYSYGDYLYSSAKFIKKTSATEYLDRVSFEVEKNTSYEVYLSKSNLLDTNEDWILLGSGSSKSSGVKTLIFDTQEINGDYTIIVKHISSEDYYLPVLCKTDYDAYEYANITLGLSSYSYDGSNWYDLGNYVSSSSSIDGCSSVIFAYTRNSLNGNMVDDYDITINSIVGSSDLIYVNTNSYYSVNLKIENIDDMENITHKIIDNNDIDVTDNFILSDTVDSGVVTIKLSNQVKAGKYKYVIKYKNIEKSIDFNIYNVIESSKYRIENGNIIIKLNNSKMINKTMLNPDINTNGVTYLILNKNNVAIQDSTGIGTNYKLKIGEFTYNFIVIGDVYSDGIISAFDYVRIRNHMMNNKITDPNELIAADVNNDSKISALDYIAIKKIIMEV